MGVNMEIMEIIKDSFVFPSKNLGTFSIYVVLSVLVAAFTFGGIFSYFLGFIGSEYILIGGLTLLLAMLIGWVMFGYLISIIKSGIELDDEVPEFKWWDNYITGLLNFIVGIVYFIIPAFIVGVVGYLININDKLMAVAQEISSLYPNIFLTSSPDIAFEALSQAIIELIVPLAILIIVALIVFVIFLFLQSMAEARLANTGSLSEALNIFEAAKDIKRIGVRKVIIVILLVFVIIGVIGMVTSVIFNYVPTLSILSIIISPYLVFFAKRATGLLYSDIA